MSHLCFTLCVEFVCVSVQDIHSALSSKSKTASIWYLQWVTGLDLFPWMLQALILANFKKEIFSKIVQASESGQTEFPFTMGLNQFDFLDYHVFCRYVARTVEQEDIDGIINICSGRPEKLSDRVEKFIAENGFQIKLNYGAFPDRPYDSKAIWGDDFKIRKVENAKKGRENGYQ